MMRTRNEKMNLLREFQTWIENIKTYLIQILMFDWILIAFLHQRTDRCEKCPLKPCRASLKWGRQRWGGRRFALKVQNQIENSVNFARIWIFWKSNTTSFQCLLRRATYHSVALEINWKQEYYSKYYENELTANLSSEPPDHVAHAAAITTAVVQHHDHYYHAVIFHQMHSS